MRYPAFVAEIGRDENREKIQAGIYTGYVTVALLAAVVFWGVHAHVIPPYPGIYGLLVAKLVTNTASWVGLRTRVLHLELATLNITCDVAVMTGAIYFTGGPLSPLVPIYFIEATVMALLTNLGLTIVTMVGSFVMYATMCILVAAGVWPLLATPYDHVGALTPAFIAVMLAVMGIVLFIPGAYIAMMVQRIRANETALAERAKELVEAAKTKSQFMANVTHELRTPIHGILGLSDLLGEGIYGPVTDAQQEAVRGIQESGRNLLELIDTLLTLARAEAAKLEVVVQPVIVDELVQSVAATARWLRGKKNVDVVVDVGDALPVVHSDRGKLVQILVNLLANAVKFTPEGGTITLTARPWETGGVVLAVRDTGVGIPAEEHAKIWDDFHQVDGSASRTFGGAGVGLAVVKRLVALLGGEIALESEVGKGSTFTVRVPARRGASPEPARETSRAA